MIRFGTMRSIATVQLLIEKRATLCCFWDDEAAQDEEHKNGKKNRIFA